jgi:hypothetical protein
MGKKSAGGRMEIRILREAPEDMSAVRQVNEEAF